MKTQWNNLMYQYLGLILLRDMLDECLVHRDEQQIYDINKEISSLELELFSNEIIVVTDKAAKIRNEYDDAIHDEHYEDYDQDYEFEPIEYNQDFYELWKKAVRLKTVVKLSYNSVSSGLSSRLVDPYKSSAPYGEGYCHLRKEVRKFRFDRVLSIEMTDEKFTRKKLL